MNRTSGLALVIALAGAGSVSAFAAPPVGNAGFVSACPSGEAEAKLTGVFLQDCPTEEALRVSRIPSVVLTANCREKVVTVRTADLSADASWALSPDLSFTADIGKVHSLVELGSNRVKAYELGLKTRIVGQVNCADPGKPVLQLTAIWMPTALIPGLPASCFLASKIHLTQCEESQP